MNRTLKYILSAVLSGIVVGIVATTYLALKNENMILGAFLFGFGLLSICTLDFKLFTGRVAYIIDEKPSYLLDLLYIVVGNLIGLSFFALLVHISGMTTVIENAHHLVEAKLDAPIYSIFTKAIICGFLMYLGVEGYKRVPNDVAKVVLNIFAVVIFIFAGVEHSIANAYYFVVSGSFTWEVLLAFIVMLLGNGVGSVLINGLEKLAGTKQPKENK
ncbi:formate/nitrite transporter family protein [Acholeplasma equirhinis]|uniref:formate/nitrite transporter family protein n=1 Tax=Acholeplasma equirhinis TaxID=555393 RepID=UPI00197A9C3D|nr:formate/nitrite transporter family protein [Acholeplasma equirhinis]MBN3490336.1 formate/nitrite transporter family protein [Acholeplasma equirhinis]